MGNFEALSQTMMSLRDNNAQKDFFQELQTTISSKEGG